MTAGAELAYIEVSADPFGARSRHLNSSSFMSVCAVGSIGIAFGMMPIQSTFRALFSTLVFERGLQICSF